MKRFALLSSIFGLALVVACGTFSGSDTSGGGGGGGDDGGGTDGDPLVTGGGTEGGSPKDGGTASDAATEGGQSASEAGADAGPGAFCDGVSLLCQDFTTAVSGTDGFVNGVANGSAVTISTSTIGMQSFGSGVWTGRVPGPTSSTAYLVSPDNLGAATFTLKLRFGLQVNTNVQFLLLLMTSAALNPSAVTFKATATTISATSSLGTMPTATLTSDTTGGLPYRTLTVTYNGSSFTIDTDDGGSATLPHQNAILRQVQIGAQGIGAIDYVTGHRLTSP